jgi:uncharacterized membrane-anchored protein
MFKKLFGFALLAIGIIANYFFFAKHGGEVKFHFDGYVFKTTLAIATTTIILAVLALLFMVKIWWAINRIPTCVSNMLHRKRSVEKDVEGFLAALSTHNYAKAKSYLKKLERYDFSLQFQQMGRSEVAMLKEDEKAIEANLIELSSCKDYRVTALEGLVHFYNGKAAYLMALKVAQQLHEVAPSFWSAGQIFHALMVTKSWGKILEQLEQPAIKRYLTRDSIKELKATAFFSLALDAYEAGRVEESIKYIEATLKNYALLPAYFLLATIHYDSGNWDEMIDATKRAWKLRPHPDFISFVLRHDNALKYAKKLASYHPKNIYSLLLLGQARMNLGEDDEVFTKIEEANYQSLERCLLLAEYYMTIRRDYEMVRHYLNRCAIREKVCKRIYALNYTNLRIEEISDPCASQEYFSLYSL